MSIIDRAAEMALLGSVLYDNDCIDRAIGLAPEDFGVDEHRALWSAMLEMRGRRSAIDTLTLADELKARGALVRAGGPAYLMRLDSSVPAAANAGEYAKIIKDRAIRRKTIELLRLTMTRLADLGRLPSETVASAAAELLKRTGGQVRRTLADVNVEAFNRMNRIYDGTEDPILKTGIPVWDTTLGGLQPTLTVIGAPGGGGKTAMGATLIQSLAQRGATVALFSIEDPAEAFAYRYIAGVTEIPNFILRYRKLTERQWMTVGKNVGALSQWDGRVIIDDDSNLSVDAIVARAAHLVVNEDVDAVVIDHFQEMDHGGQEGDRSELKMRHSLQGLRDFANDYRMPVVLLAQTSRQVATASQKSDAPPSTAEFCDAKEAMDKVPRVVLILRLDKETSEMQVWCVKNTNGQSNFWFRVKFVKQAGLVAPLPLEESMEPGQERLDEDGREPDSQPW